MRAFGEALSPWLPPRPPRTGPPPVTEPDRLRQLAGMAGLADPVVGEVVCPFRYPDEDALLAPLFDTGIGRHAINRGGPVAVRTAVLERCAEFRRPDGSYLLLNRFRVLTARGGARSRLGSGTTAKPLSRRNRWRESGFPATDRASPALPRRCGFLRVPRLQQALAVLAVRLDPDPLQPGPPQVQRHLRRGDAGCRRRAISSGASSPCGSPSAARRVPHPVQLAATAAPRPSVIVGQLVRARRRRRPAAGRPGPGRPARPCGRTARAARPARRRPRPGRSPANDLTNPACAATPPLISLGGVVVGQRHVRPRHPRDRRHRVVGVGDHQEREVRRAEERGQPQTDGRPPPVRRTTVHDSTKSRSVMGSSSSGSSTVPSAAHTCGRRVRRHACAPAVSSTSS